MVIIFHASTTAASRERMKIRKTFKEIVRYCKYFDANWKVGWREENERNISFRLIKFAVLWIFVVVNHLIRYRRVLLRLLSFFLKFIDEKDETKS
jgi:hypothetical protein